MNLKWPGSYPFTILIITSVLGDFTDINFRIEISGKRFMMITCITVYDVQILNFVEIMFSCICRIDSTYTRIKTTTQDSCQPGFFETIVVSPLPAIFKMSFIFGLIVRSIQIVHSSFQTSFHNGQVLIGEGNIDNHFRFEVIE